MELERYRKHTQKDVKNMYDKALEDKHKVKQMEKELDEVDRNFTKRKEKENLVFEGRRRRTSYLC